MCECDTATVVCSNCCALYSEELHGTDPDFKLDLREKRAKVQFGSRDFFVQNISADDNGPQKSNIFVLENVSVPSSDTKYHVLNFHHIYYDAIGKIVLGKIQDCACEMTRFNTRISACKKCSKCNLTHDKSSLVGKYSQEYIFGMCIPLLLLFCPCLKNGETILILKNFRCPCNSPQEHFSYTLWMDMFMGLHEKFSVESKSIGLSMPWYNKQQCITDIFLGASCLNGLYHFSYPRVLIELGRKTSISHFDVCSKCSRACSLSVEAHIYNKIPLKHEHHKFNSTCALCYDIWIRLNNIGQCITCPIGKDIPFVHPSTLSLSERPDDSRIIRAIPCASGYIFCFDYITETPSCLFKCGVSMIRDQRKLILESRPRKRVLPLDPWCIVDLQKACWLSKERLEEWLKVVSLLLPEHFCTIHKNLFTLCGENTGKDAEEVYTLCVHPYKSFTTFYDCLVMSVNKVRVYINEEWSESVFITRRRDTYSFETLYYVDTQEESYLRRHTGNNFSLSAIPYFSRNFCHNDPVTLANTGHDPSLWLAMTDSQVPSSVISSSFGVPMKIDSFCDRSPKSRVHMSFNVTRRVLAFLGFEAFEETRSFSGAFRLFCKRHSLNVGTRLDTIKNSEMNAALNKGFKLKAANQILLRGNNDTPALQCGNIRTCRPGLQSGADFFKRFLCVYGKKILISQPRHIHRILFSAYHAYIRFSTCIFSYSLFPSRLRASFSLKIRQTIKQQLYHKGADLFSSMRDKDIMYHCDFWRVDRIFLPSVYSNRVYLNLFPDDKKYWQNRYCVKKEKESKELDRFADTFTLEFCNSVEKQVENIAKYYDYVVSCKRSPHLHKFSEEEIRELIRKLKLMIHPDQCFSNMPDMSDNLKETYLKALPIFLHRYKCSDFWKINRSLLGHSSIR